MNKTIYNGASTVSIYLDNYEVLSDLANQIGPGYIIEQLIQRYGSQSLLGHFPIQEIEREFISRSPLMEALKEKY